VKPASVLGYVCGETITPQKPTWNFCRGRRRSRWDIKQRRLGAAGDSLQLVGQAGSISSPLCGLRGENRLRRKKGREKRGGSQAASGGLSSKIKDGGVGGKDNEGVVELQNREVSTRRSACSKWVGGSGDRHGEILEKKNPPQKTTTKNGGEKARNLRAST